MRDRHLRTGPGLLALALLAPVAVGAAPAAADPAPALETLLPDTLGDGGPAAAALVNAARLARTDAGDLVFVDTTRRGWADRWAPLVRRVDAGTGHVAAVPELPALPEGHLVSGDGVFLAGDRVAYVVEDASTGTRRVLRGTITGGALEEVSTAEWGGSFAVLAFGADGSLVVNRLATVEGVPVAATSLVGPDGTSRLLVQRSSTAAALAADGTVFVAGPVARAAEDGGGTAPGIERVRPDGTVDVVAGPGPVVTAATARADGVPATSARLRPDRLAVTPDGSRVVYVDRTDYGARIVRSFAVGGEVRTVAGRDKYTHACTFTAPHVLADPGGALVTCGGIRSYAYDGSAVPRAGTVVAGANAAPGLIDAADGTPLAHAYLSRLGDLAADPATGAVAMATRLGAYVTAGTGEDATLVRAIETGASPGPDRSDRSAPAPPVDVAYGPDSTLYLFAPSPVDDARWRLRSLAPGAAGPVTVAAGTGEAGPSEGALLSDVALTEGHLAVGADGTIYLSQGQDVWAAAPVTGLLRHVAAVSTPAPRSDIEDVTWLGVEPGAGGRVLVADAAAVYRVAAGGALQPTGATYGHAYAPGPDGSVYTAVRERVWRQRPDGARVVVAPGVPLQEPTVAALADGRIAVGSQGPTAAVHLLRPTDSVWAGPAPTLTATAATRLVYAGKTVSTVTVQVAVPEGADWTLEGRVSADPADLAPTQGAPLWWEPAPGKTSRTASFTHYDGHWVSGGESSTATPVEPGQKFFVRLWPSTGDGAIAPPPLSATVRVPKVSSAVTLSTKATVLYARNTVFSGTVTVPGADGRIPAGGAVPVVLQSRPHGGAWTTLANLTADADGRFHHERRVYANREYRVLYAGTDAVAGATSPIRAVGVPYDLSATAGLLHRLPDGKWNFSIYGWVRPRPPSGTVTLQRWVVRDGRGRWVTVARPHVTAGGSYLVDIAPGRPPVGTVLRYRVRISGGDLEPHDVVVEKVIQRKLA